VVGLVRLWVTVPLVFATMTASAHSVSYIGGTEGTNTAGLGVKSFACDPLLGSDPGIGWACFAANHLAPDQTGASGVQIEENTIQPVSGFYCQDNNGDGICGGGADYGSPFCTALVLFSEAPEPSVINWDPAIAVQVFVDGPVAGSNLLGACHDTLGSYGTVGTVTHW
jgi:hypothetical protein